MGTNGKIAVIGRKMDGHVKTVAEVLKREGKDIEIFDVFYQKDKIFHVDGVNKRWQDIVDDFATLKQLHGNIPDNVLQNSMMYKANKIWAEKLKTQGYTVIDIGYPDGIATSSIFYNMELTTIYK